MPDVIEDLTARVLAFRDARDWGQFHSPKNLSMALACEAAEIMDLFRWLTEAESVERANTTAHAWPHLVEEIGDVGVFLLVFCRATGVDLREAILAALAKAEVKYPVERSRGRAEKWTTYRDASGIADRDVTGRRSA